MNYAFLYTSFSSPTQAFFLRTVLFYLTSPLIICYKSSH